MSVRLHVLVEGETEERFVRRVLAPHLGAFEVFADARQVETSRRRHRVYRGGVISYEHVLRDLQRWMKEDGGGGTWFSTMLDLYALPGDFPGFAEAARAPDPYVRAERLETAFANAVAHRPFVPYVQLHEFEALLLAEPQHLDWYFVEPDEQKAIQRLITLVAGWDSPELIDDGRETAPSKRIIAELPGYANLKATVGTGVVEKIGLPRLRERCPHFGRWVDRLERLGSAAD
ncbi:MAG TPA: DUF4276 family protein [Longimicrobium sp.]|nr:DUF4276 family protein [Longimicrobium sp.]